MSGFVRLRVLWGAVDFQGGSGNPYSTAQTKSGGTSAKTEDAGVGVRRCELVFDRSGLNAGEDVAVCHFDFMNLTGGDPDDTWTDADYETCEGHLDDFWAGVKFGAPSGVTLKSYKWFRAGAGIVPPNPALRVFDIVSPVAGTGSSIHPPQVAVSLTLRNAVRRSWGRTYLPLSAISLLSSGDLGESNREAIVAAGSTLISDSADDDFVIGTTSLHLSAFLVTEQLEVDSVMDVVRRRRASIVVGRSFSS